MIEKLLKMVAFHDLQEIIEWDHVLSFYILCNDVFYWGCADLEEIETDEDVDLLEKCILDVKGSTCARYLYCARKRGLRLQGAMYKHILPEYHHIFDEVGPPREINFCNPKQP